jgi:citrate lyase subunit beta / citryl-CoA lyase
LQAQRADAANAEVTLANVRSFLFVPGDSSRKLLKAAESDADALIVDLEDAVAPREKPRARSIAREFVSDHRERNCWLRINPLDTEDALADLRALMSSAPAGIVLPKPYGAKDAIQLGKLLDVLEQEYDLPSRQTAILPVATERPGALFHLHEYAHSTERLAGLTWGAEDLGAAVGASANRDGQGNWLPPYELARSLCLLAAAAAEVPAIDTVFTNYRDHEGLRTSADRARRDGFSGMLAIHPAQVAIINESFLPDSAEVERARRIVELFAATPEAGTVGLDGRMLDRPHLLQAQRILEVAKRLKPDT